MLSTEESKNHNTDSSLDNQSKYLNSNLFSKDAICAMDNEKIQNVVLPRIRDALDNGFNDEAIRQSNIIIDNLKDKQLLVSSIKLQMKAWRNKGNLTEQLKHAKTLMQLIPEDPEGYTNAAEVYSIRGQQNSVMDIAKEGMEKVADISGDAYERLARQHDDAETRASNCIDFLVQLPYDLVYRVIDYLPQKHMDALSQVSRPWQDLILYYPNIWRIYLIEPENNPRLLSKVARHIEELRFRKVMLDEFIQVLGSSEFPMLERLCIDTDYWDSEKYNPALSSMSSKVIDIDLLFYGEHAISLSQLLMDFRNLTSLSYFTCSRTTKWLSVPKLPYITSLQKIHLGTDDYTFIIKNEQINSLLKNSPYLRILTLCNADESVLSSIYQYCQNLTILNFDNSDAPVDGVAKRIPDSAIGLHYLYLHYVSSIKNIKQLLEAHWKTLKSLNFKPISLTNLEPLTTITLPCIEDLTLDMICAPLSEQQVITLLQHCPCTRSLTLVFHNPLEMTANIFRAIGSLQHLGTFDIQSAKISADEATATQEFQKLKEMKHMTIRYCSEMAHVLFTAVTYFPNLESIYIHDQNALTINQLQDFTRRLSILKHLQRVLFSSMTLSVDVLKEFQNNKSVKRMRLRLIKGLNERQARQALPPQISLVFGSSAGEDNMQYMMDLSM